MPETQSSILVLINPKSGLGLSMSNLLESFEEVWGAAGHTLRYQLSLSAEDGARKTRQAIDDGTQTLIVVGGDGMINSIGRELLDSPVTLGVIPTGSGNGFARHFNIPLNPRKAIRALLSGVSTPIDVGEANGTPFFVTCSLAWDAALVRTFEKSPVRGIFPYVFAAAYELFDYSPERFRVRIDHAPEREFDHPMLFTVANLTQYGGGARIAPQACHDDGFLWLTTALRADIPKLIPNLWKLFDGSIQNVPEVFTQSFHHMQVIRETAQPIQIDGELLDSPPTVEISIRPKALRVLVPPSEHSRE